METPAAAAPTTREPSPHQLHEFHFMRVQTHKTGTFKMYGARPRHRAINSGISGVAEGLVIQTIENVLKRNKDAVLTGYCVLCEGDTRILVTIVWWEDNTPRGIVFEQKAGGVVGAWDERPFDPEAIDCNATWVLAQFEAGAWRHSRRPFPHSLDPVGEYLEVRFRYEEKP